MYRSFSLCAQCSTVCLLGGGAADAGVQTPGRGEWTGCLPGVAGTLKVAMWPQPAEGERPRMEAGWELPSHRPLGLPTWHRSPTALARSPGVVPRSAAGRGRGGPGWRAACLPRDPASAAGGSRPVQAAAPAPFGSVSCVSAAGASARGLACGAVAHLRP